MRSLIGWLGPSHQHHPLSTMVGVTVHRLLGDLSEIWDETTVPGPLLKNGVSLQSAFP